MLTCENSRLSLLLATSDAARVVYASGTWSGALIGRRCSYIVLAIVYERQTKDKRPMQMQWIYYKKNQCSRIIFVFTRRIWVTQKFTIMGKEKHKNEQRHQHGISVAKAQTYLLAKRPYWRNVPSGEEREADGCFRGLVVLIHINHCHSQQSLIHRFELLHFWCFSILLN